MPIARERLLLIDRELQSLSNTFGVGIERQVLKKDDSFEVSLRLMDLPKPAGLSILIADDYFSWHIELRLDSYSDGLIKFMRNRLMDRIDEIDSLLKQAKETNTRLNLELDGNSNLISALATDWNLFFLSISKSYKQEVDAMSTLNQALFDFMCILLLFLTVEIEWNTSSPEDAQEEGEVKLMLSRKYERSRINRAICLRHHGFKCKGCETLLEEVYGPIGENVIHVHHITPVSKMGGSYKLDPVLDLIPLCPNCHNIVHRTDPPIDLDSLKQSIIKK